MQDDHGLNDARGAAQIYDQRFVPALFRRWGPIVAEAAAIGPGQRVLDVACGTGALTCCLPARVAPAGEVVGLDANAEMLEVARSKPEPVQWLEGRAEALPFADASFDAVVSQFGLMFFGDRVQALCEMMRVLRPGGRLAVAVWQRVEQSPGYAILSALLDELFESAIGAAFRAPFALGDAGELNALCAQAGIAGARVQAHSGLVRFASAEELLHTERACVWTLGGLLDDAGFERLRARALPALQRLSAAGGAIEFACPALIVSATK